MIVLVDGRVTGAIALADVVRPEARSAIEALKALHIRPVLGAVPMSAGTVVVVGNARLLKLHRQEGTRA